MLELPADPLAFQARIWDALTADILDVDAQGFPRMEALRAVSIATRDLDGVVLGDDYA